MIDVDKRTKISEIEVHTTIRKSAQRVWNAPEGDPGPATIFTTIDMSKKSFENMEIPARVESVTIYWSWIEDEGRWRWNAKESLVLLKPDGKPYRSGWRSGFVRQSWSDGKAVAGNQYPKFAPEWVMDLVEESRPQESYSVEVKTKPRVIIYDEVGGRRS